MWSIDGIEWEIPCTIERVAEMQESDISGMMLDKHYFNDVIGTFLKYSLKLEVPFGMEQEYAELYELLTEPVDGHSFVLPYAGGVLEVTGRVGNMKDVFMRLKDGSIHWRGISFDITANHPSKTMSLEEVLTRGATPLPDESDIKVGETYVFEIGGWNEITSAEDNYY